MNSDNQNNDNLILTIVKATQAIVLLFVLAILVVVIGIIEANTHALYKAFNQPEITALIARHKNKKLNPTIG